MAWVHTLARLDMRTATGRTLRAGCRSAWLAAWLSLLPAIFPAHAAPFVPARDDVIVERLRDRPLDQTDRELRKLRAALRQAPGQLALAVPVAQRCIAIARRDGDPRYIGYAEAALMPWWQRGDMPPSVRLLKAVLLQSLHQFGPALQELDALLAQDAGNAQALLTSASILQVQGRYGEAGARCLRLGEVPGAADYANACLADLRGLQGDPASAAAKLEELRSANPALDSWLRLLEAELAERAGDAQEAQREFAFALSAANDAYTKAAYADFLLDQGRPAEVITLLTGSERSDPLLLRLALAYHATHDARLAASVSDLQSRFDAAHLRGDRLHLREEARFALELQGQPNAALALAQANWEVQKEPADMRILLASARAANNKDGAEPVRRFIADNRISDVRLTGYLQ